MEIIHRPPRVSPIKNFSSRWTVHRVDFFFIGDTLQWMVENPIFLGGQWTLDGGLIGDTLGGKFKFVEVTLFLHFTTTIYAT